MKPTRWRQVSTNTWARNAGYLQLRVVQGVHVDGSLAACSAYIVCHRGIVWESIGSCQTVRGAKCIATSAVIRIARDIKATMIEGFA